jgi:peptidoglycan-associated lipoprotein
MVNVWHSRKSLFPLWLIVFTMLVGCTGRRVTTAVEDQLFQPGRASAPITETAKAERVEESPVASAPPSQPPVSPVQLVAELMDVYFDFDQYAIRGEARSILEANAGVLRSQPDQDILIEGHCDERGTGAYNLVLGERRAQAAKRYLEDLGVAPSHIRITSYGKERPFCREHSEACWQSNRRAHFRRP